MLHYLKIRNYAIIRESEIQFNKGLNIITGETGAGKSILMGALGLILGERADTKVLLPGAEKLVVEGGFQLDSAALREVLEANELDFESTTVLRRELNAAGKSRAFINDTPVNLQTLKEVGVLLIDLVSQHQTLELNEEGFQLDLLDSFAKTLSLRDNYQQEFKAYSRKLRQLNELREAEQKARQEEDYLRFVCDEIRELNPIPEEEQELENRISELEHAEQIQSISFSSSEALKGAENSLIDQLKSIQAQLSSLVRHHQGLPALVDRINSNLVDLDDIASELSTIADKTHSDPEMLAELEARRNKLIQLQKKHRVSSNPELLELFQGFESRLAAIGTLAEEIEQEERACSKLEESCRKLANELSSLRATAAPQLENQVLELLREVAIPQAQFESRIETSTQLSLNGFDKLSLWFTANKGFPMKQIQDTASGGELSRLMLCLKSLLADEANLPSIVFDEIDTGISGEAALRVASVMSRLSNHHQVIAITHLPQIASQANHHFYVFKDHSDDQTTTRIKLLSEQEQVEEIARMLSGENPGEAVIQAAKEMMKQRLAKNL